MAMNFTVNLQDLPKSGRQWCLEIPQALLADDTCGDVDAVRCVCTDAHWQGSIERVGDVFSLRGEWKAAVKRCCSRCTVDFEHSMQGDCVRVFRLSDAEAREVAVLDGEDQACELLALPGAVNLMDVLREDIWLNWLPVVICKEDCLGLCQRCGENLNQGLCKCPQQDDDHAFAALKNFRFDA